MSNQTKLKLKPELSVHYAQIMKLISHIPAEPKMQIGQILRQSLLHVNQAMDYVPKTDVEPMKEAA
jgi:hypothetical protein